MDALYSIITLLLALLMGAEANGTEIKMNQIKTYMSWSQPIDPAKIITIADMDLSYALASTLVEWDQNKQIQKGIAEKWDLIGDKTYRFVLPANQKWSDGSKMTCDQIKASFERGMKAHPEDLRSLANILEKMTCGENYVDFVLKSAKDARSLLGKLTEPNYGVLRVRDEKIELSVSSGAFSLQKNSPNEIILAKNPHWVHSTTAMADEVIIRKPPRDYDAQTALKNDAWVNLVETSSLMKGDLLSGYRTKGYEVWERPIDKVFLVRMSKRLENQSGHQLFRYLREHLNRQTIVSGLSGYSHGEQIFPKGYQLYDPDFSTTPKSESLPEEFKKRPLEITFSRVRVSVELQKNLEKAFTEALGITPKLIEIDLSEQVKRFDEGNFDIYVGTMGLADPDPEGVMSYYIENKPSVIPKSDGIFLKKLDEARKTSDSKKRIREFQKILTEATYRGYVFSLFHLSTIGIGKAGLDFSLIPASEESVTLSKVRFKGQN